MLEDQAYQAGLQARCLDDANFARRPAQSFAAAPAPLRPLITALVRRSVRRDAQAHGFRRHGKAEVERLGIHAVAAAAARLGDKPYLLGDTVSGADAACYAFAAHLLCPLFETPLRTAGEGHANLVAYAGRMGARYDPETGA